MLPVAQAQRRGFAEQRRRDTEDDLNQQSRPEEHDVQSNGRDERV